MEFGTIEREIYVEASPEIVFEVVSSPDHLKEWWPDDARYGENDLDVMFAEPRTEPATHSEQQHEDQTGDYR